MEFAGDDVATQAKQVRCTLLVIVYNDGLQEICLVYTVRV